MDLAVLTPVSHALLHTCTQVKKASYNADPHLRTFGITVNPQMMDLHGRVLSHPKLQYGGAVSHLFIVA